MNYISLKEQGVRDTPLLLSKLLKTQINILLFVLKEMNMTEDITPQNIYQDEDIYANLSDKELKDLYEDLEAGFLE